MTVIEKDFKLWCKQTERNGGIITGKSLREFFKWFTMKDYGKITELLDAAQEVCDPHTTEADLLEARANLSSILKKFQR